LPNEPLHQVIQRRGKNTRLFEHHNLQFRTELYNSTKHAQLRGAAGEAAIPRRFPASVGQRRGQPQDRGGAAICILDFRYRLMIFEGSIGNAEARPRCVVS
jgi:hypothetical protein